MDNKTAHTALFKLQEALLEQHIPFVSYQLPLQNETITLAQQYSLPEKINANSQLDDKTGFVLAAFNDSAESYFLTPDSQFNGDNFELSVIEEILNNNRFSHIEKPVIQVATTTHEQFTTQVNTAIEAMRKSAFQKVVLSKVRVEPLPQQFNAADFYEKLCQKYPHAFVYLLQIPTVGCWIGATPEPLLVISESVAQTVSLAGTQIAHGKELNQYQWTEKELEEQGIVTKYVGEILNQVGITDYKQNGPFNYQAANLIHLKTSFEFSKKETKNKLTELLHALHPTPSVGGLPKKPAETFILKTESHPRSYYTGYLGPVNINKKTNIFVNLRCLQLHTDTFVLYSGAGITAASIAENEWIETENKMLTMMNVLKS